MASKTTMIRAFNIFLDTGQISNVSSQEIFDFLTALNKHIKLPDSIVKHEVGRLCGLDGVGAAAELYKYLKSPMPIAKAKEWVEKHIINS